MLQFRPFTFHFTHCKKRTWQRWDSNNFIFCIIMYRSTMFINADGVIYLFKRGWPKSKGLYTNEKVTVSHQVWILGTHDTKMNPGKTNASVETGAINQHLRPLGDSVYQTWKSRNSNQEVSYCIGWHAVYFRPRKNMPQNIGKKNTLWSTRRKSAAMEQLYINPRYSGILIGSRLWSVRGYMHDWRHHHNFFFPLCVLKRKFIEYKLQLMIQPLAY